MSDTVTVTCANCGQQITCTKDAKGVCTGTCTNCGTKITGKPDVLKFWEGVFKEMADR